MDKCGRLIAAKNVYAWFDHARKQVTVSADVELNPFTTTAHICPNPLARISPTPEAREFLVEGVEKAHGPIVPLPVVVTRVYHSFHTDATPAKVRVYTLGIDNPAAQDIPVKDQPPPALFGAAAHEAAATTQHAPASVPTREKIEGHGWSDAFSFEEALASATKDLLSKVPHHPDVTPAAEVVKMVAHVGGGSLRNGLELIVRG
jgi:hypothetical protein